MIVPIFTAVNVSAVQALLKTGSGPLRFYSFGLADQNTPKPYAVWQQVFGAPENYVSNVPDIDSVGIQVDVYADSAAVARQVGQALSNAIEPHAHITSWHGESRDPDTMDYRYGFDCQWWLSR